MRTDVAEALARCHQAPPLGPATHDHRHRSSARDDSSWREILEYFEPADQLGMTATPLRDDNRNTYAYFGEPVYSYSLRNELLDKYAEHGVAQFKLPDILQVPPLSAHGNVAEIARLFGGADDLRAAVTQLQALMRLEYRLPKPERLRRSLRLTSGAAGLMISYRISQAMYQPSLGARRNRWPVIH